MTLRHAMMTAAVAVLGTVPAVWADIGLDGAGNHRLSVILDVRAGLSPRQNVYRKNGIGLTRLGGEDGNDADRFGDRRRPRLFLGQLGLDFHGRLNRRTTYLVELNSQVDGNQRTVFNVPEAFVSREVPWQNGQLDFRAGLIIPHFSLEHPGTAWSTFFTLTPSAINTWIGEEVRAMGLEGKYSLRLAQEKKASLTLAAFQGNDPSGVLLSWRGWAMHDVQAGYGDWTKFAGHPAVTNPAMFGMPQAYTRPFLEVDDLLGGYGAFHLQTTRARFSYGYWANNARRTELDQDHVYGWDTRFQHLGWRLEPTDSRWLLQSQVMWGRTRMGKGLPAAVENDFAAWYLLASRPSPTGRWTVRYDDFRVKDKDRMLGALDPNEQVGHAWTLGWTKPLHRKADLTAEVLSLSSKRPAYQLLGLQPVQKQLQVQVAYRLYL